MKNGRERKDKKKTEIVGMGFACRRERERNSTQIMLSVLLCKNMLLQQLFYVILRL